MSTAKNFTTRRNDPINIDKLYVGGIDILDLLAKGGGPSTPGTGDLRVQVTVDDYIVISSVPGMVEGDIVKRIEVVDTTSTPPTTTEGWLNFSRQTLLSTAPDRLNLRLPGEGGLKLSDIVANPLKVTVDDASGFVASVGKTTDPAAAGDGSGNYNIIQAVKRTLLNWAELFKRIPVIGQKDGANSLPVVIATTQEDIITAQRDEMKALNTKLTTLLARIPETMLISGTQQTLAVTVTNASSIGGGGGGTGGTTTVTVPANNIEEFTVDVAAPGMAVGDTIKRITVFNTTVSPVTATIYWFNATTNAGISAPTAGSYSKKTASISLSNPTMSLATQLVDVEFVELLPGTTTTIAALEAQLGGKILSIDMKQDAGAGSITTAKGKVFNMTTGASMKISADGGGNNILNTGLIYTCTTGHAWLFINYRK